MQGFLSNGQIFSVNLSPLSFTVSNGFALLPCSMSAKPWKISRGSGDYSAIDSAAGLWFLPWTIVMFGASMGNNYREKRILFQMPPISWITGTHEKTMIAAAIRIFSLIYTPSIMRRINVV
ncbi:MAG TPA: hypothetical protein PLW73_02245 [Methanoregulaceae archaeon]|nr:hypothetical protein [Methanoregulaceae archaeon]